MKRIFSYSLIYALGNAANSAALLLVIPYLINTLTPAEYGAWSLFELSIFFLNIFILAGLEVGLMREYWFQPDEHQRAQLIGSTLLMVGATGLVIVTGGAGIVASGVHFGLPGAPYTLFMVLALGWSDAFFTVFLTLFRMLEYPVIFIILSIGRLALFAALLFCFVESDWGLTGALGARLLAALAVLAVAFMLSRRWIIWRFDRTIIRRIASYGLPMLPTNVAAYILLAADRYVIQGFLSLEDVALYSFAYKIATVLDVLITRPFALDWAPRRFKIAAEPNPEPKYVQALLIYLWAAVAGSLGIIALTPLIYTLLAPPAYWPAMHLVPVILLAYIIYGLSYPLNIGIMLKDRTQDLPMIGWIAAIACLGLCFWWIPMNGITGAAWATVVAYAIWTSLIAIRSLQLYPLRYSWHAIISIISVGMIGYGGLWLTAQWLSLPDLVAATVRFGWSIIIMGGCGVWLWHHHQRSAPIKSFSASE